MNGLPRTIAALAAIVVGTTSAVACGTDEPARPPLAWGACPEEVVAEAAPSRLDCATVPVPLDHADPASGEIEIMISRLAGPNPEKRRGVLLSNPGGPGGSGLAFPAFLVARGMPASVTDSYDVIGIDTRGIGHSAPVECGFTGAGPYVGNLPPYAVDAAAVTARAEVVRGVAQQCADHDPDDRLRHISTAEMARDLDAIRAALGEEKASFLGYSYGSALGAAYASMFPDRADRVVLDSIVGDTHLDRDGMRRYALGMEQTFPDFAAWAAARDDTYGLGRTPDEVRAAYLELADRLDREPVDGLTGAIFRGSVFAYLFDERQYPVLAGLWQSLRTGAAPPDTGEVPDLASFDNSWTVFLAVTCNDVDWPEEVQPYRDAVAEDRERYPLYGAAAANIIPCAYWPHEPAEPPVPVLADGPANILLVQNRRDVPTPHRGAELLRAKFGDRARLVSVDAAGHGAYLLGENPCANDVTTAYLVDGTLPAADVSCPTS
ncbi:alpha/beta hydrolase [Nocardia asteroides]|uniref:alpha/beta hydrolase n=1 Tax=Nocardia asteroides TaxID=1824 RepID=UPI001E4ABC20|nr:alpha/beta hydrolase [Nocardia asteroides]UGT62179.1 alpha/beta hydrolase [Nocardia asteroides]